MFVCCECYVLSGSGLCDGLITRPGESHRLWCVAVCDLENLITNEEAMAHLGAAAPLGGIPMNERYTHLEFERYKNCGAFRVPVLIPL